MAKATKTAALASVITLCTTYVDPKQPPVPPGTLIELPANEALDGIARGLFADPATVPAPATVRPARPDDPAAVVSAIVEELRGWSAADLANEELVTASGKPSVPVLAGRLGYEISAAERDAAFDQVKGQLV